LDKTPRASSLDKSPRPLSLARGPTLVPCLLRCSNFALLQANRRDPRGRGGRGARTPGARFAILAQVRLRVPSFMVARLATVNLSPRRGHLSSWVIYEQYIKCKKNLWLSRYLHILALRSFILPANVVHLLSRSAFYHRRYQRLLVISHISRGRRYTFLNNKSCTLFMFVPISRSSV
jgi:hypothetical protein